MALLSSIDHVAEGLARVVSQYRGKPKLSAYYACFLQQVQYLEDATQAEAVLWDIDTAAGWRLDILGARVGQVRVGTTDAEYRLYVKARILANRSLGKVSDLRRIAALLIPAYVYREDNTNVYIEDTSGTLDAPTALAIQQILQSAASAGIRVWLLWGPTEIWFSYCATVATGVTGPGGWAGHTGSTDAGHFSAIIGEI